MSQEQPFNGGERTSPRSIVLIGGSPPFAAVIESVVRGRTAGHARFTHARSATAVTEADLAGACVLVHLGRRETGVAALESVLPIAKRASIVAITESEEDDRGLLALQRGAHEHISAQGSTTEQLLRAVRAAHQRRRSAMEREARDALTAETASLVREILDSLEMMAVAVDGDGTVFEVNQPWRDAPPLIARGERFDVGDNYLERCDEVARSGDADLAVVADGVRAVLTRATPRFETDCVVTDGGAHVLRVVVLPLLARAGAVVTHTVISDAEQRSRAAEGASPHVAHPIENALTAGNQPDAGGLRDEIERAVRSNELSLAFQPIVAVSTGRVVGAEALLRWRRVGGHWVSPASVIAEAERSGAISGIGRWVLHTACARLPELERRVGRKLGISINLSGAQLGDPQLHADVVSALQESGCDPSSVCLEVTETAIAEDMIGAVGNLDALRRLAVSLALDDLGTGYASLQYAKLFRVNIVKIDQIFVREITRGGPDRVIVASVVSLAHGLGALVIAEGVETEEQRRVLAELDCDGLQGFLLSRPLEFDDFVALCEQEQRWWKGAKQPA